MKKSVVYEKTVELVTLHCKLLPGEELIYQTGLSLSGINNLEWKKVYVNAELKSGRDYEISLEA